MAADSHAMSSRPFRQLRLRCVRIRTPTRLEERAGRVARRRNSGSLLGRTASAIRSRVRFRRGRWLYLVHPVSGRARRLWGWGWPTETGSPYAGVSGPGGTNQACAGDRQRRSNASPATAASHLLIGPSSPATALGPSRAQTAHASGYLPAAQRHARPTPRHRKDPHELRAPRHPEVARPRRNGADPRRRHVTRRRCRITGESPRVPDGAPSGAPRSPARPRRRSRGLPRRGSRLVPRSAAVRLLILAEDEQAVDDVEAEGEHGERPPRIGAADRQHGADCPEAGADDADDAAVGVAGDRENLR